MLTDGEKATKVYQRCGFRDYVTFYRAYKAKFGVSPKDDIVKGHCGKS